MCENRRLCLFYDDFQGVSADYAYNVFGPVDYSCTYANGNITPALNHYLYCAANPIMFIDPSGMSYEDFFEIFCKWGNLSIANDQTPFIGWNDQKRNKNKYDQDYYKSCEKISCYNYAIIQLRKFGFTISTFNSTFLYPYNSTIVR